MWLGYPLVLVYSHSAPTGRKAGSLARAGKMLTVVGAAVGLFFSAVALWKCRAGLFGATSSGTDVTGAAASRRLADKSNCVSAPRQKSVCV